MSWPKHGTSITANAVDVIPSRNIPYEVLAINLRVWLEGVTHHVCLLAVASDPGFLEALFDRGEFILRTRFGLPQQTAAYGSAYQGSGGGGGLLVKVDDEVELYGAGSRIPGSTYDVRGFAPLPKRIGRFGKIVLFDGLSAWYRSIASGREYYEHLHWLAEQSEHCDAPLVAVGERLSFDVKDLLGRKAMYSYSHVGNVRRNNEDAALNSTVKILRGGRLEAYHVLAVADGVGGAGFGELASKIAIISAYGEILRELIEGDAADLGRVLGYAISTANQEVLREKGRRGEMGTTLTIAVAQQGRAFVGHVGDSRAYRVHGNGRVEQLTEDHKYVEELVKRGAITREQAKHHPQRNVITSALGMPSPRIDTLSTEAAALLLATDGLVDLVEDYEIEYTLQEEIKAGVMLPQRIGRKLVGMALRKGGYDNVSVSILTPLKAF